MPLSFRVTCSCGAAYTGVRQATQQVLSCQRCQRPVFVLPESPWMPGAPATRNASVVGRGSVRWLPWLAATVVLSLVGGIGGWLLVRSLTHAPANSTENVPGGADYQAILSKAQGLLSQGQFRRAPS